MKRTESTAGQVYGALSWLLTVSAALAFSMQVLFDSRQPLVLATLYAIFVALLFLGAGAMAAVMMRPITRFLFSFLLALVGFSSCTTMT